MCVYTSSFSLRSPSVTPLGRYLFSVSLLLHAYRTFLYRHDAVTSGVNLYKIFVPFAKYLNSDLPPLEDRFFINQSYYYFTNLSQTNQSIWVTSSQQSLALCPPSFRYVFFPIFRVCADIKAIANVFIAIFRGIGAVLSAIVSCMSTLLHCEVS